VNNVAPLQGALGGRVILFFDVSGFQPDVSADLLDIENWAPACQSHADRLGIKKSKCPILNVQ